MIRIYLVRHGIAVDPAEMGSLDDEARPLTGKGRKRFRRLARAFRDLGEPLDFIFTSPLVRAVQTAEILCGALRGPGVGESGNDAVVVKGTHMGARSPAAGISTR